MSIKMKSTRGTDLVSIDEAILSGLAFDGGLFVPETFPEYVIADFYDAHSLSEFATRLLAPFFVGSRIKIDSEFCNKVFSFAMPLHHLEHKYYALELFHGPTLSFKDFGAQFFGQCLADLVQEKPITVLVATSGDTGSAVASALHGKRGIKGVILFPEDKISARQQAQITCWGDNISAVAVHGSFDQCQQLVKKAFANAADLGTLTTANSINIARLIPQILFYAYSSISIAKQHNEPANFIVPSGNLGNVTACYWAKRLGFPVDEILIANNANDVLSAFLQSGHYQAKPSVKTLANAMDVGDPSNLERLVALFPDFVAFKAATDAVSVSDEGIREAIIDCYARYHYVICPHTATAYHRLQGIRSDKPWVIAATAHPVKFNELIEPLLGIGIPVPERLAGLLEREQSFVVIEPVYEDLARIIY